MKALRLYLFGTPRLEYQGTVVKLERRKSLALAAYLALTEQQVSRDVVAGLLWPELDDERARTAFRSALYALNAPFPFKWIQVDRKTLALNRDQVWVDVQTFLSLIREAGKHQHDAETLCDDCAAQYQQAAQLYTADFLSGFYLENNPEYSDWQFIQSQSLRREMIGILRRLAQHEAAQGHWTQAIDYTRRWLSLDELHEPAHRLLMRVLTANGQRSEALHQYERCVQLLDEELATIPEEETTRLYRSIQENRLSSKLSGITVEKANSAAFVSILPPLPPLVFGREGALHDIRQALNDGAQSGEQSHEQAHEKAHIHPTVVIQGWPGVGKSTLTALIAHDTQVSQRYPDGVLWTSLGENPDLLSEISIWADAVGLSHVGRPRRPEEISTQITAVLREKRVLLLVDDVWKTEHAAPFRVGGQWCAMIMTSRLNDVASALASTADRVYRLPVLTEAAGLELLARLAPETVAQYPQETQELVRDLEGLPLAIHVAGRLLQSEARFGWGIGDLLAELRAGASLLMAQPPSDMLGVERDTSPTVATLLKRSTDILDEETRSRFALLGLFVPKPATFDLAAMSAAWGVPDARATARTLVNRGLLEPVGGGRFQMHALLVLHARSLLETQFGNPAT